MFDWRKTSSSSPLRPSQSESPLAIRKTDYLGIMLLGRIGIGKSVTGNKLIQAGGDVFEDQKVFPRVGPSVQYN